MTKELEDFASSGDFRDDYTRFSFGRLNNSMKYFGIEMAITIGKINELCESCCPMIGNRRVTDIARLDDSISKLNVAIRDLNQQYTQLKLVTDQRNTMTHVEEHVKNRTRTTL